MCHLPSTQWHILSTSPTMQSSSVFDLSIRLRWDDIRSLPSRVLIFCFDLVYQLAQIFIILLFKPVRIFPFAALRTFLSNFLS